MIFTEYLTQLNTSQREAVTYKPGNLLVLAGAGSGKTRVLVNRVAWLILENCSADPASIFVVTFTNKAAKEMNTRLKQMDLPNMNNAWIGTFHGLAHKLLRLHYNFAGLDRNFAVLDVEDQLKIIKTLIKNLNLNDEIFEPRKIQHFINKKKDEGIRSNNPPKINTRYDRNMFEIYKHYENACSAQNVIDFAELLLKAYELLLHNKELLMHYHSRFRHFLVDEFQDTNAIQYNFLKLLSSNAASVTAVGDDDQSIYGWRGAQVENIVKYTKEFNDVAVIRLEKNYRSTKTILAAANAVIDNNFDRMGKTLWTDSAAGDQIVLYGALNEEDEANFIVARIKEYLQKPGNKAGDIAILYRSNAQSRVIEEYLVKSGIAYVVYGGVNFFERAEIKDILAYLRLAINPQDDAAFSRIINVPARGIGEKSLEKIILLSQEQNINYFEASKMLANSINNSGLSNFIAIINNINNYFAENNYASLSDLVQCTIDASGIINYLKKQKKDINSINRIENLQELVNATINFDQVLFDSDLDSISKVQELLNYAALEGKEYIGNAKDNNNQQHVQLMTLHAAKGLEFPVVFLCGLEEGLFPHYLSKDDPVALNEERRLCYVGITRSMHRLFITYAKKRRLFGKEEARRRSRFIGEIPNKLIKEIAKQVFVKYPAR